MTDQELREALRVIFDEAILLAIATFLLLKALIFRRFTEFGRALSRSNLALALAYYGVAGAMHIGFFRSDAWRWGIRVLVVVTTAHAVHEMIRLLGGWRAAGRELRIAAVDFAWEIYRLPATLYDWCCRGYTLGDAAFGRASVWRQATYIGGGLLLAIVIIILLVWIF